MKRILAVLCLSIAASGLVSASPAVRRPSVHPAPSALSRAIGGFLAFLRSHLGTGRPEGGHDLPPPGSATASPLEPAMTGIGSGATR